VGSRGGLFPAGTKVVAGGRAKRYHRDTFQKDSPPRRAVAEVLSPRLGLSLALPAGVPPRGGSGFRRCRFARPPATTSDASGISAHTDERAGQFPAQGKEHACAGEYDIAVQSQCKGQATRAHLGKTLLPPRWISPAAVKSRCSAPKIHGASRRNLRPLSVSKESHASGAGLLVPPPFWDAWALPRPPLKLAGRSLLLGLAQTPATPTSHI
jgi:hypothetical protein